MKQHAQIALFIGVLLYLVWGIALLVAPESAHGVLSKGAFDPVMTGLFAASLVGITTLFVFAGHNPTKELTAVSAVISLCLGLAMAILMGFSQAVHVNLIVVISVVVSLSLGLYLFISQTEGMWHLPVAPVVTGAGSQSKKTARKSPGKAAKKTAKKKTAKKKTAKKKTAKKKTAKKAKKKSKKKAGSRR
ncbi:MAG: hypothetical protein BMS9Abin36_0657 [Gammaproteobacteria bacterium]|nr:MAG: hypothetical protein BMS9Abin36_0657 [Gammaproteobacteria bacterium]